MDPAQVMIQKALELQKPMNEVIDRGDSPIQQFYRGSTVFVTGASGYMGKHLIEKIFRSCAIKKMYLLLRSKKGKSIQDRLQLILSDPVYDLLRDKQPMFADKITVVEGDVADNKLGLSDEDWHMITKEVDIILHAAATVRFDEPLRTATLVNVRGTRDTLALAQACTNLKSYVYVSTAYSSATKDRIGKEIYEKFYPSPVSPDVLISLAEELDANKLAKITDNFINGWPNTYTFTKAVAEELIRTSALDLPVCVVRPPIVLPAYYEPTPGWLDMRAVMGPSGINVAALLGVLNVFRVDDEVKVAISPLEYVNNAIIAAAWDIQQRRDIGDTDIPIYTVSNKDYFVNWGFGAGHLRNNVQLSTDKAVYMCGTIECKSQLLYWLLSWLLHYVPAYILDAGCAIIGKRPPGIKSFVAIYRKIDTMASVYSYFLSYQWDFRDDNIRQMLNRMSEADRAIYNCDISTINFAEYVVIWSLGVRKYIIKDGLNNSNLGRKKQKIFTAVNYVVIILYAYVLYYVFYFIFYLLKYILNVCF